VMGGTDTESAVEETLRIAVVGPLPPPPGGIANQTRQLCELLDGEGVRVEVVRVDPPYRPAFVRNIRGVRALFRLFTFVRELWRVAGRVEVFHVMANSGWSWHLFAVPAIWVGSIRGLGVVVNYRGGGAARFLQRQAPWVRLSVSRAHHVIVPSSFLKQVFACHAVETEVIPNVVNTEKFYPAASSELQASWGQAPHAIMARNLEPIYDVGTGLRAFALILESVPNAGPSGLRDMDEQEVVFQR